MKTVIADRPVHVPSADVKPRSSARVEHLKLVGWRPFAVASHTNWCGHGQEFIPVPEHDGWCWLIPVLGEAA